MAADANRMGLVGAMSYVVGTVIGTGIFITPVVVLKHAHSVGLTLLLWVVTGFIAILGSFVSTELATSIPKSGGIFAYSIYVGWKTVAFASVWIRVTISIPSSSAAGMATLSNYFIEAIGICPDPVTRAILVKLIAYIVIWSMVCLNVLPLTKSPVVIQVASTVCKLTGLVVIIGIGFWHIIKGDTKYLQTPFEGSNWDPLALGLGIYGTIYSYAGWDNVATGMEEVKKPSRNGPISIIGGMLVVMVVYVMTNVAYFTVLGPQGMLHSKAVAQTLGKDTMPWLGVAIPFVVCISIIGGLNSGFFAQSRMFFAMAREKYMPNLFTVQHADFRTPVAGVLLHAILTTLFVSFGKIEGLLLTSTFIFNMWQIIGTVALIYIRIRKLPVAQKAVRMPLLCHILYLLILIPISAVPVVRYYLYCSIVLVLAILLGLVYHFLLKPDHTAQFAFKLEDSTTKFTQKLLLCVPNETESVQLMAATRKVADSSTVHYRTNAANREDPVYIIKLPSL